jgi:hypothetical protein
MYMYLYNYIILPDVLKTLHNIESSLYYLIPTDIINVIIDQLK